MTIQFSAMHIEAIDIRLQCQL